VPFAIKRRKGKKEKQMAATLDTSKVASSKSASLSSSDVNDGIVDIFELHDTTSIKDLDLEIRQGKQYRLVTKGSTSNLRYDYKFAGTYSFSSLHLSNIVWELLEQGDNFERVRKCVEKAASPCKKKQFDSTFEFLPLFVQIKARFPDAKRIQKNHTDVDDIHRGHFINVFINVFHKESVDQDFGAPFIKDTPTNIPQYYGLAYDSAVPHRTGWNRKSEVRYLILITWVKCRLEESSDGKSVYSFVELPGDLVKDHYSWFENKFNVELRPQIEC